MNRISALLAFFCLTQPLFAGDLQVGSPAPPLELARFVKGEEVKKFDAETTYVVEFWATWCGPCKQSMPHISQLQKKFPHVIFIGVDCREPDSPAVDAFVKEVGAAMDYRVAVDKPGKGDLPGAMDLGWLTAAEQPGIPTAFIVKGGKILFIDHPMKLDVPLANIEAGTYDLAAATKAFVEQRNKQRAEAEFNRRLKELQEQEPTVDLWKKFDRLAVEAPEIGWEVLLKKVSHACQTAAFRKQGVAWADELIAKPGTPPELLNDLADELLSVKEKSEDLIACALRSARRADRLTRHEDPMIIDTLAHALFESGDVAGAVTNQTEALRLSYKYPDAISREELKLHLQSYQKAAAKAKAEPKAE